MSNIDQGSPPTFPRHPTARADSPEQHALPPLAATHADAGFWKMLAILLALTLIGIWALYEWYNNQLDNQITSEHVQLTEKERELATINSQYLLSRSEQQEVRQKIAQLQERHATARKDWDAAMEALRQEKVELDGRIGELKAEQDSALAERESQIEQAAAERDKFASANELLQSQYAAMTLERDQLQEKLKKIEDAIAQTEAEHLQQINALEKHLNERIELSHQTPMDAKLAETAMSLGILSGDQPQQDKALAEKLKASEQALEETREELQKAREELAALPAEAGEADGQDKERLAQMESDHQAMQQQLVESRDALTDAREQLKDSRRQLAAAEERADTLAAKADEDADLNTRLETSLARIAALESKYQGVRQQLLENKPILERTQEKLRKAEAELASARQQLADSERQDVVEDDRQQLLDDLKQSRERIAKAAAALEKLQARQAGFVELGATYSPDGLLLRLTESELRFALGSAELPAGDYPSLERIAKVLKRDPELTVRVVGHTDSQGPVSLNRDLSRERAEAVASALKDRGIDPARITTAGLGEQHPIADNDTGPGRSRNRRVEVYVVE